jgi:uncharacterized protein (DUF4213/DUF364 family)
MGLIDDLLASLLDGEVVNVCIGLHWTAVVAMVEGKRRCGLSSTLESPHEHSGEPQVPQAGYLERLPGHKLAAFALERTRPTLASVGLAAINAQLPSPQPEDWIEGNAEHLIANHGAGKRVAIVGHFPFITRLNSHVGELMVLDKHAQEGDLPADAAPNVLPQAEVVAITGMAIANHTLEDLLKLCSPQALVMVLGPSTPPSQVLFDYGVHILACSVVTAIEPVLQAIVQGANFRQIHRIGVKLVTLKRPELASPP